MRSAPVVCRVRNSATRDLSVPRSSWRHLTRGRKSHACCPLLPRPPGQHLDHGYVRPRAGGSQPGRRHVPGQPATCRASYAAKRVGANQRPRGRLNQRLGSLGSHLVHPGPPAQLLILTASRAVPAPVPIRAVHARPVTRLRRYPVRRDLARPAQRCAVSRPSQFAGCRLGNRSRPPLPHPTWTGK
jgi:hypothetical protein